MRNVTGQPGRFRHIPREVSLALSRQVGGGVIERSGRRIHRRKRERGVGLDLIRLRVGSSRVALASLQQKSAEENDMDRDDGGHSDADVGCASRAFGLQGALWN